MGLPSSVVSSLRAIPTFEIPHKDLTLFPSSFSPIFITSSAHYLAILVPDLQKNICKFPPVLVLNI